MTVRGSDPCSSKGLLPVNPHPRSVYIQGIPAAEIGKPKGMLRERSTGRYQSYGFITSSLLPRLMPTNHCGNLHTACSAALVGDHDHAVECLGAMMDVAADLSASIDRSSWWRDNG